ncbi:MAG: SseB family protein [Bdellovibrionota bacterium]
MADSGQKLTQLLEDAADGKPGAAEKFFEALLQSDVYVPIDSDLTREKLPPGISLVGQGKEHFTERKYVAVDYQGAETLPIFTEEAFIAAWSEREFGVDRQDFKTLLWLLGDDNWLYLNPSQEVGKEFTPWEIALLKKGAEAIPDLVAALNDDAQEEFTISSSSELYPELKEKLLPILTIYPELREAFLVSLREGEEGAEKPALGIKYAEITEAKKLYLRSELENASSQFLPPDQQLFVVDDLGTPGSPNWKLFSDATPFYIAQAQSAAPKKKGRLFGWLKRPT